MASAGGKILPWAAALGRVPSGLFVLTVRDGDRESGMLASWVQQCSFDPPLVSVAVNRERVLLDWLKVGAAFGINILPEGEKSLLVHFGKGIDSGERAFDGLDVIREGSAAPALAASHAFLDCRVVDRQMTGDHVLVIGRVVDGRMLHEGRPATHVRRSGLHY